jgi:long-subunit acyl-CoA synthetase (AMP-forming)
MKFAGLLDRAAQFHHSTLSVRTGAAEPVVRSFPEFITDVRALQDSLLAAGVRRGQVVGLQAAGSYEFLVWDLALIELGAVPQVFPEDWSAEQIRIAAESSGLALQVTLADGLMTLRDSAPRDFLCGRLQLRAGATPMDDADLLTRVYSSGTTGRFKGLKISRRGTEEIAAQFLQAFHVDEHDRYLFFLPLSHFQQRHSVFMCLHSGTSMHWTPYSRVFHDLTWFRPTFMIGPPSFFETALATLAPRSAPAGTLAAALGGQMRFMITGMAPIRRSVLEGFRQHGVALLEAYGLTEIGLVAWNVPEDNRIGSVGRPLSTNRVEFTAESELLVQPQFPMSRGYFTEDGGEAASTFLGDGRIATGDIGELVDGHLVLRGRKKDIIVTSGGVKFHPAELEQRILACEVVRQTAVFTDLQRNDLVAAIVVDNPDDAATRNSVQSTLDAINAGVRAYMRIARSVLTRERFSPDNQLMTRNLKPNRGMIARHFSSAPPGSP